MIVLALLQPCYNHCMYSGWPLHIEEWYMYMHIHVNISTDFTYKYLGFFPSLILFPSVCSLILMRSVGLAMN